MKTGLLQIEILLRESTKSTNTSTNTSEIRMRNLHKFIEDNHVLEALPLLQEWGKCEIKDSDDKKH